MEFPRLAIVGTGRMGSAVRERAASMSWEPVAIIGSASGGDGRGITRESLNGAEVAIEFTTPSAAPAAVRALLAAGCAVVSGTTGWTAELEFIMRDVRSNGGTLLHSPNFSLGAAVLALVAERAATLLSGHAQFQAHIVETHHAAKIDAPSGTAAMLARVME